MTSRAEQGGFSKRRTYERKPKLVCPSCGEWCYPVELTGFCIRCTNEHERGGAAT